MRGQCFLSKISIYFKPFSWHNQWLWTMKDNAWIDKRYHILLYIMNHRIPVHLWFSQECCQQTIKLSIYKSFLRWVWSNTTFTWYCLDSWGCPGNIFRQDWFFDRMDLLKVKSQFILDKDNKIFNCNNITFVKRDIHAMLL